MKNRNSKVVEGYSISFPNRIAPTKTVFTIAHDAYSDEFIVHNTASRTTYVLNLSEVKDFLKEIENE